MVLAVDHAQMVHAVPVDGSCRREFPYDDSTGADLYAQSDQSNREEPEGQGGNAAADPAAD